MILAGDIGGTKTVLAIIEQSTDGAIRILAEQTYASTEFASLEDILSLFLSNAPLIHAACFGIAGPVINQRCQTVNLPWVIDGPQLQSKFGIAQVKLLNDLEAMALGMLHLPDSDFIDLNPDAIAQVGNIAVIAAGTGLGEAMLFWDGNRYHAIANEGGHSDFAPVNLVQDQLLSFLRKLYPEHVSYERVLSGNGFSNIYDFLIDSGFQPCPAVPSREQATEIGVDRNAVISRLGLSGEDMVCQNVVQLFAEIYGAEAGNVALKTFATGGVYIGGGIAPKIKDVLNNGYFVQAFRQKGRLQTMLQNIPVKLALNPRAPLIGAMHYFMH